MPTDRKVAIKVTMEDRELLDGAAREVVALKAVKEEAGALGRQVDDTSRDMDGLAISAVAAKKEVGGLGDKARSTDREMAILDRRINATKRSVTQLGFEFAATGDKATGAKFTQQQSMLSELERLRGELAGNEDNSSILQLLQKQGNKKSAASAVTGGAGGAGGVLSVPFDLAPPGLKPALIAILVGAAAAAAPAVGAILAGAVTGVVGLGGIAGGIFAASKNEQVRRAASLFGHDISTEFFGSGDAFVEPIKQSLAILSEDFKKFDLKGVFAEVAPFVTTLAHGLGGFVGEFLPGFRAALREAGPAIAVLAKDLPTVGKDLGEMFETIAQSKGTLQGLRFGLEVVDGLFISMGNIIGWLGDRFDNLTAFLAKTGRVGEKYLGWAGLGGVFKSLAGWMDVVRDADTQAIGGKLGAASATGILGQSTEDLIDHEKDLADALAQSRQALDDWINKSLDAQDARIAVAQDFADLNDKLIKGKKNWDDNSQAGRDNQQMIGDTIKDLERQRVQAVETSDGSMVAVDKINKAYNDQIDHLKAVAVQAGDTKAALDKLDGTHHITIVQDTIIQNQLSKAASLDRQVENAFGKRAGGGPLDYGTPYLFGEQGPEIGMFGPQGGRMWSTSDSRAMAWSGGGGSGGAGNRTITVVVKDTSGRTLRTELITDALDRGQQQSVVSAAYP